MSISREFAYNPTHSIISGVDNYGDLSVPKSYLAFNSFQTGLSWWAGPDETNRYVIAYANSSISRTSTNGKTASIWFRSSPSTVSDFITLVNSISSSSFIDWDSANDWLVSNGYWTNFDRVIADGGSNDANYYVESIKNDLHTSLLLGSASLVMIPSKYKESVLFTDVPSTPTLDFGVTRATTATRINSLGYIEPSPSNLLNYSEDLTTSDWFAVGVSKSINYISEDTSNGSHLVLQVYPIPEITGINLTAKFRIKAKGRNKVEIRNNAGGGGNCYFDLSNGTKYIPDLNCTSTISPSIIGNNWYDITYTYLNSGTGFNIHVRLKDSSGNDSYVGDGVSGVYIEKLQLNRSDSTEYIATTNRLNVPRIDFSTVEPSVLVEEQRTNIILQSNAFDTSPWLLFGAAGITASQEIGPNGTNRLFKLTSAGSSNDFIYQAISTTVGVKYSVSLFVKNFDSSRSDCYESNTGAGIRINWSGSSIVSVISYGGNTTNINYRLFGSDIWLVSYVYTNTVSDIIRIYADSLNTSKSIFISNMQIEAGAFPSSYIPTTSSSVTRNADNISLTRTFTADSTIYCKTYLNSNSLSDATSYVILDIRTAQSNRITLYRYNNIFYMDILNSSSVLFSGSLFTITQPIKNEVYKFAISITSSSIIVYINGFPIYTNLSISIPTLTNAVLNYGEANSSSHWCGNLGELLVYNYSLSNDECSLLTSNFFTTFNLLKDNLNYTLQ